MSAIYDELIDFIYRPYIIRCAAISWGWNNAELETGKSIIIPYLADHGSRGGVDGNIFAGVPWSTAKGGAGAVDFYSMRPWNHGIVQARFSFKNH